MEVQTGTSGTFGGSGVVGTPEAPLVYMDLDLDMDVLREFVVETLFKSGKPNPNFFVLYGELSEVPIEIASSNPPASLVTLIHPLSDCAGGSPSVLTSIEVADHLMPARPGDLELGAPMLVFASAVGAGRMLANAVFPAAHSSGTRDSGKQGL